MYAVQIAYSRTVIINKYSHGWVDLTLIKYAAGAKLDRVQNAFNIFFCLAHSMSSPFENGNEIKCKKNKTKKKQKTTKKDKRTVQFI